MGANHRFEAWTPAREAELRDLWSQELSARAIAAKMGGISRNAVLGKVFRMHLPSRPPRNGTFYKSAKIPDKPIKRSQCKTVFPNRERKPQTRVIKPDAGLLFLPVMSPITGAFITARKRPHIREMTKIELRAMLTQAVINTGGAV